MSWNDVWGKLVDALIPLIGLVLTFALTMLADWLRARAKSIRQETIQRALTAAINEAQRVADDAINATNQTLVDDLKEQAEDGKLTGDEVRKAMGRSIKYFTRQVSAESLKVLQAAYGPIGEWIEDYIEARLGNKKSSTVVIEAIIDPLSSEAAV